MQPDLKTDRYLFFPDTFQSSMEAGILLWSFSVQSSFLPEDSCSLCCLFSSLKALHPQNISGNFHWGSSVPKMFLTSFRSLSAPEHYTFYQHDKFASGHIFPFLIWFIRPGTTGIFISQLRYILITSVERLSLFSHSILYCCSNAPAT